MVRLYPSPVEQDQGVLKEAGVVQGLGLDLDGHCVLPVALHHDLGRLQRVHPVPHHQVALGQRAHGVLQEQTGSEVSSVS